MGNYFLRKGTNKEATLFVRIRKRVPKIDKNVNTRIVIDRNVYGREQIGMLQAWRSSTEPKMGRLFIVRCVPSTRHWKNC